MRSKIAGSLILLLFLGLVGGAAGDAVGACSASAGGNTYSSIMAAVAAVVPGPGINPTTINVSGTCSEVVFIPASKNNLVLNGVGGAEITCPGNCGAIRNVTILGKQVSIQGFNITGGLAGILVAQGASATISNNTISGTANHGIVVVQNSLANIYNNTIQGTGATLSPTEQAGITLLDGATAYIGLYDPNQPPSPNFIRHNANGILLRGSATAIILGNTIGDNTNNGIMVVQGSQAQIADNLIHGNGQDGIFVSQGSGVYLGYTPKPDLNIPNSGTNGDKGISCSVGGYVDGPLGGLDGAQGGLGISKGCFNSVTH